MHETVHQFAALGRCECVNVVKTDWNDTPELKIKCKKKRFSKITFFIEI